MYLSGTGMWAKSDASFERGGELALFEERKSRDGGILAAISPDVDYLPSATTHSHASADRARRRTSRFARKVIVLG
jgi:hypothetical protein